MEDIKKQRLDHENDDNLKDYTYNIINNEITITSYTGTDHVIHIPDNIDGYVVTKIGAEAMKDNQDIMKVILPDTIKVLEKYAFCGCNSLTEFYFVDGIESIGAHCFYNCRKLKKVSLRGELKDIGDGAFKNCYDLAEINIRTDTDKVYAIKYPIDSLMHDVKVNIEYLNDGYAALYFPKDEVYYSYYTTRLNDKTTFGVGNNYHNCIGNGVIDYKRYDGLFLGAKNFLVYEVLREIAMSRLMYPYQLVGDSKEKYLDFVKEHSISIVCDAIELEKQEVLDYFIHNRLLNRTSVEYFMQYSIDKNKVEITSLLINYQNKNYNKRFDNFDL